MLPLHPSHPLINTPAHTSGLAGASLHLSQQSPLVWLWASGSKHTASPHQLKLLQGSAEKGPSIWPGRCALFVCWGAQGTGGYTWCTQEYSLKVEYSRT